MGKLTHRGKPVDTIFVHCSATRPEWLAGNSLADKIAEVDSWHKGRGWSGFGYHWAIDRDGRVAPGRPETEIGAHVAGHNTGSIGICLIGGAGSSATDPFDKNFTPEQDAALRRLIDEIKSRADIKAVRGHNEVAAKACPGFQVDRWLAGKSPKASLSESSTVKASAIQAASGAGAALTAIGALDGHAQIVLIALAAVTIAAAAWVMRERIKRWARE